MISAMKSRVQDCTSTVVAKEEGDVLVTYHNCSHYYCHITATNLLCFFPSLSIPFPVPREIAASGSVKEETQTKGHKDLTGNLTQGKVRRPKNRPDRSQRGLEAQWELLD